jgi:large subunit ribosomal protein L6
MSRVGKSPVKIPAGVKINVAGQTVNVEGPKGKLAFTVHERIKINKADDGSLVFERPSDAGGDRALHGTTRAVVNNMVTGVSKGFSKELEIRGVGYRGEQKGKAVNLVLGYSHPILFEPPAGVTVKMDGNVKVVVEGIDRQKVGQVAATIRGFKPPEPYKGKGVRYLGEQVIQKEVKKT